MHKFLFYNKFFIFLYMFRALCAHHKEVKTVLYNVWYRHTCRWPSRSQVERGLSQPAHRTTIYRVWWYQMLYNTNCVSHLVEHSQNFNFVHKTYLYVLSDSRNGRRASSLFNKSRLVFNSLKANFKDSTFKDKKGTWKFFYLHWLNYILSINVM